ncbi:MAG: NAD(P)H-quinone oxidoreductase [Desulfosarcinaceae bacterium]|nr:NAD(P)H-quinone oxidoreductase [Desulfosarcinaceae bacterium]
MMRYIHFDRHGGPEVLTLRTQPAPTPDEGEVLIQVHAAGVNRPDILQRRGLYAPPPDASPILGLEVAGEVMAVGKGVSQWSPGDAVCALTNGGGYAEMVTVPGGQVLPVPGGLPLTAAAALPETFFTVWINVFERAGLQPGETLLVHGGSSGIGTAAIQMARVWGARVFITAGTAAKCAACRELGADLAVNYRREDFVDAVMTATDGKGVDVILDMVGGTYVDRNLQAAARDGRIAAIAFLEGSRVTVDLMPILLKRVSLTGSTLRPRSAATKARIADMLRKYFWPHIASGEIQPRIAARFPLAEAAEAHQFMESGTHIGKILLALSEAD